MAKTWLDLITPYQSGDHADGGDFTFTETERYDGGTFAQTDRYHHIYSLYSANISTDDVIITGIRVTNDEDTYLYGEEGYVLEIENNPFALGKESSIATHLGQKIIGMQFRPLSVTAQSNPLIEAGDLAYVSHKGNGYRCFVTNMTFTIGQNSQISCDAKTPQGARVKGMSGETKNIVQARKVAKREISTYDLRVKEMTALITNGFGLFKTKIIDDNGGIIYYMHDQPTIDESEYRWFMTTGGIISQKKVNGEWQTLSGVSKDGNALYNIVTAFNLEVGNEIQMAPDATINWGNINAPSDLAYTSDIPSDNYITNITKNAITTTYIKGLNLEVGNEIQMGANAVITWENLSEESKDNLTGKDGRDGVDGVDGRDGSDANVPSYITSTKITKTTIESPTITAGEITGGTITGTTIKTAGTGNRLELSGTTLAAYDYNPDLGKATKLFSIYTRGVMFHDAYTEATVGTLSPMYDGVQVNGLFTFKNNATFDGLMVEVQSLKAAKDIVVSGSLIKGANKPYIHIEAQGSGWVQYSDGTMVTESTRSITGKIASAWGSLFYFDTGAIGFPKTFIEPPIVTFQCNGRAVLFGYPDITKSNVPLVELYRPVADTVNYTYVYKCRAVGRWK